MRVVIVACALLVVGSAQAAPASGNILGKLKIYKGDQHPHAAQQPKPLKASS